MCSRVASICSRPQCRHTIDPIVSFSLCPSTPIFVLAHDLQAIHHAVERITLELTNRMAPEDRLRALAQLFRYREDALQDVPDKTCVCLAEFLRSFIEDRYREAAIKYRRTGQRETLAINFREACRIILFLLRRRIYSDAVLDPIPQDSSSEDAMFLLASDITGSFQKIERAVRRREMDFMTGAVDQIQVFKNLVNYINKQGRGVVVFDL